MSVIAVISGALPPAFFDLLRQHGEVRVKGQYDGELFAGASVLVASAMDPVDAETIAALPDSVGLIANVGIGTDNIDLAAAAARGIAVSNTPVVTEDTADLAMALLLATCRRLTAGERLLREGSFGAAQKRLGARVHGKTLGIVGFGAIGQAVALRAAAFSMPVRYWGPRRKPEAEEGTGAQWCGSLEELLGACDIVSLHCPLTAETRHLINADKLARCKPGMVLINTGRGSLIDEAALIDALQNGPLGAAGLDDYEFEPRVSPGLLELDNVVLLPHIGSATAECRRDMALRVCANIGQFLSHGHPLDQVR